MARRHYARLSPEEIDEIWIRLKAGPGCEGARTTAGAVGALEVKQTLPHHVAQCCDLTVVQGRSTRGEKFRRLGRPGGGDGVPPSPVECRVVTDLVHRLIGRCCVARSGWAREWRHDLIFSLGVRWFPVPSRGHLCRGAVVPEVRPVLPGRRGAARRAGRGRRSRHHLPVGPTLHTGVRRGRPSLTSRAG